MFKEGFLRSNLTIMECKLDFYVRVRCSDTVQILP